MRWEDRILNGKRKNDIINLIYFTGLILIVSVQFFRNTTLTTTLSPFYQIIMVVVIILFLIKYFLFQKNNFINILLFFTLEIIAIINYKHTSDGSFVYLIIAIFASKDIDGRKIVEFIFKSVSILLVFTIVLALLGKIPNYVYTYNVSGVSVTRQSLGMTYPTKLGATIMYMVFAYLLYKNFELNAFQKIMIFVIAFIVKKVAYAKTAMILICLAGIIAIFYKPICRFLRKSNIVIPTVSLFIIFFSIHLAYHFNTSSQFYQMINSKVFSNRLYLGYVAAMTYPIKAFGQHIYMRGYGGQTGYLMNHGLLHTNYFFIDSFYLQALLIYGLVIFLITVGSIVYFAFRFNKERKFALVIVLLLIVLDNVYESYMFQCSFNFLALLLLANTDMFIYKRQKI